MAVAKFVRGGVFLLFMMLAITPSASSQLTTHLQPTPTPSNPTPSSMPAIPLPSPAAPPPPSGMFYTLCYCTVQSWVVAAFYCSIIITPSYHLIMRN